MWQIFCMPNYSSFRKSESLNLHCSGYVRILTGSSKVGVSAVYIHMAQNTGKCPQIAIRIVWEIGVAESKGDVRSLTRSSAIPVSAQCKFGQMLTN